MQQQHAKRHAKQRRQEREHGQPRRQVTAQQPEPRQVTGKRNQHGLVGEAGQRGRCEVRGKGLAGAGGHQQQQHSRDGKLVQQRLRRRCFGKLACPHDDGCRAPQRACHHAQRVAQRGRRPGRRVQDAVGERQHDPRKCNADARPLARAQMFARHEKVQAERREDRRGVEEHRHARGSRVAQADEDAQELDTEQHAGHEATSQRAVAQRQARAAPERKREHQDRRDGRAHTGLHDGAHVVRGHLDGDLLKAPAHAQDHHQPDGGAVQRPADRVSGGCHRASSVPGSARSCSRPDLPQTR